MNKKKAYAYYFVIILIMAIWDGIGVEIPMVVRVGFLALTYLPLFIWRELIPAVLVSTMTIAYNAFTYPLLPTSNYYYVIVLVLLAFSSRKAIFPSIVFIASFLLVWWVDFLYQGRTSWVATKLMMCLLVFICVEGDGGKCNEHMPYAFMMVSVVLSYWILFRDEARTLEIHVVEGFEESGGWTDPNYLSCIIVLGCIVAINELLSRKGTMLKTVFCYTTIGLSVFALAYLASRGAFVSLGVGILVMLLFSKSTRKSSKIIFVVLILGLLVLMYTSDYFNIISARFQSESMMTGTGRTIIWQAKLDAFFNEGGILNWIFGFGNEGGLGLGKTLFGRIRATHNDFVSALVEYGFIGLGLYIYVFFIAINHAPKENKISILAFVASYIAICMTLEPTFSDMPSSIVFVFFLFYILMFSRPKRVLV